MYRLLRFRSPLLSESRLISFPLGNEMFQFPRFRLKVNFHDRLNTYRVPPFRYLRINARCQLPEAFRRLPRLSSPLTAKASTQCAYFLDPFALSLFFNRVKSVCLLSVSCFIAVYICYVCLYLKASTLNINKAYYPLSTLKISIFLNTPTNPTLSS